jgi:signal transduction histidine kinase
MPHRPVYKHCMDALPATATPHDMAAALGDAQEQLSATVGVLRVIARSPGDAQPVFDSIAEAALRLCRARSANVFTYDGALLHIAALAIVDPNGVDAMRSIFPRPASRDAAACRAVLTRRIAAIPDVLEDPDFVTRLAAVAAGFRSVVGVPLLRDGEPVGAIAVGRAEPGPFPASQIALLEAFAEQAVMAIENMRLFAERESRNRELAQSLEQQTATSEILRVIAGSTSNAQPVFDAIVAAGVRLFDGAALALSRAEGGEVRPLAIAEDDPQRAARWRQVFPFPLSGEYIHGAAILEHRVVDVADVLETGGQFEAGKRNLAPSGYRAMTVVPLISDGEAIGAIAVVRMTPGPLSQRQIALLQAFADQAVIAIENTRLFNEREARNRELAEALEQQTATSGILRVISRSPTDVRPVFQTIADAALRLCDASVVNMLTFDGRLLHVGALAGLDGDGLAAASAIFPRPPARDTAGGMAVLTGEVFMIEDVLADPHYIFRAGAQWGVRSALGIPLLRHGAPIGALAICRPAAGPFPDQLVALLRTFADQAVIAIENVRLFTELRDKTRELEVASRHKSAFLANMSHELRTPMNAILGFTRIVLRETRAQLPPKQAENLEKILDSARHLVGLINATLDLTRIEAGRIEITPCEIALAPLLDECLRSVEPLCAEGVRLRSRVRPGVPPLVADVEKLHQILINLLGNAVKFTEHGSIELRAAQHDGRIVIEVEDTGIGIPPGKLEAVFEEFEQVDASHTRAHGGTGLGLAIARRLARAMGGDLVAQSALGRGSTFTLNLPLVWSPADEA